MDDDKYRAIINPWLDRHSAQASADFLQETLRADQQAERHGTKGGSQHALNLANIPQRISEKIVEDACVLISESPVLFPQFSNFERKFVEIFDELATNIVRKLESPFAIYPENKWVMVPADSIQLGKSAVATSRGRFAEYVSMQKALLAARLGVSPANEFPKSSLPSASAEALSPQTAADLSEDKIPLIHTNKKISGIEKGGRNRPDWYPALESLYERAIAKMENASVLDQKSPRWPTDKEFLKWTVRDAPKPCGAKIDALKYHRQQLDRRHNRARFGKK